MGGGVFRSIDNGDTWTEQNNGFTAVDVNSLAINSQGDIFAGASGGAFRSTSNGDEWGDISGGLIPVGGNVWGIAIDTTGFALAGTGGGGIFRSLQSTTTNFCPQTRRYWRDNPDLWPVDNLLLGSQSYTKVELQKLLQGMGRHGDASVVLAVQLISAKLNLASGSDPGPIRNTIDSADAILSAFSGKLPYEIKRSSPTGEEMADEAGVLIDYNHGQLTPDCGP